METRTRGGPFFIYFYLRFYLIVVFEPDLSEIGQAFGQLLVLTRMNHGGSLIPSAAASPRDA